MRKLFLTGTSRGIGRAMAEAACAAGDFRVVGYARHHGPDHPRYRHHTVDLADPAELALVQFPKLEEGFEQLVLVNNAGTLGPVDQTGHLDARAVDEAVRLNLTAPAVLSNAFVRRYRDYPAPKLIVHVGSGAARSPYDGWSVYCATKAGLEMLARVQEQEFARDRIEHPFTVRVIAPGVVETGMQETIRSTEARRFSRRAKFVALHEGGDLSDPGAVSGRYLEAIRALAAGPSALPDLISRIPQQPAP